MNKLRVLYILHHFPQISETYIRSEIEALCDEFEIRVVGLNQADYAYRNHVPFSVTDDPLAIERIIDDFAPDVLHSHWLQHARILAYFGGYFGSGRRSIPFTVRSHSFDILEQNGKLVSQAAAAINSELCLGVLAFPFARSYLEIGGVHSRKIHDCYPVVNFRRFYDASPNGAAVMNVGACLPKKQMQDYLELACAYPDRRFDLYALGYHTPEMTCLNAARGEPVKIIPPVEPEEMAAEYKKHAWLVYTASRKLNSVGWPMAVAEAQAAGVGVCLPNIRPDLREYVGDAGFLYDSIDEVANLLRNPFPEEMRQRGFELAKRSDIERHKTILTSLWYQSRSPVAGFHSFTGRQDAEDRWGTGSTIMEKRDRLRRARLELEALVSEGTPFILVDEDSLGPGFTAGSRLLPFFARGGEYGGPPENDDLALAELERLRESGARLIAFAWPAFWWLDHYRGFSSHLRSNFTPVLENERLIVFDLRSSCPARSVTHV